MELITQISDLKAVSGGYIYNEFVTENTIFYNSVLNAAYCGITVGGVGAMIGVKIADGPGAIALGILGAYAGAYLGFNYNDYSNIEPNTMVTWHVTYVYY